MKKAILVLVLLLISATSFAQKISPDNITGIWQCVDYKIEIFRSKDSYSARLLWSKDMFEADGKTPKKDVKIPMKNLEAGLYRELYIFQRLYSKMVNMLTANCIAYKMGILIA